MKPLSAVNIMLFLALGLFICTGILVDSVKAETAKQTLVAGGCVTEFYLMQDLTGKFNSDALAVDIRKTGNMRGMMMFAKGELDFAFLSMPHMMLAKNMNIPPEKIKHMKSIEIAQEPILVVVSKDVGVGDLTKEQVTAIFNGEITNWKELGGADQPVVAASLNENAESGLWAAFKKVTIGMMNDFKGNFIDLKGPEASKHFLAKTKGGITYIGLSSFDDSVAKVLAVNGFAPTTENFQNGTYPLVAKYYLTYNKDNPQRVQPFIDFIFSEEGQEIINQKMIAVARPIEQ